MVYRPVIMKQLLASNLLGRFVVPLSRPALATEGFDRFSSNFGRRSYHSEYDEEEYNVMTGKKMIKPMCERREDDENCYLFIHMPGFNIGNVKSKINSLTYHWLRIEGNKVQEDYKRIKYTDSFYIPGYVKDGDPIVGKMEDGELTITLPKMKEGDN